MNTELKRGPKNAPLYFGLYLVILGKFLKTLFVPMETEMTTLYMSYHNATTT